ncbi:MAG: HD domain-containing protein [Acidobacteria bacterium]|nr:HD domain-containing protein [Acidobacteriota bacterium]
MRRLLEQLQKLAARLLPRRIPLLYLLLAVLLGLSVIPLVIYGWQVSDRNRNAVKVNEQRYQLNLARSLAQEIRLYVRSMNTQTESLVRLLEATGATENVADPKHAGSLRRATEGFVRTAENVLYLNIVNADQRGIFGGDPEVGQDHFVRERLADAFQAVQQGNSFHSPAFLIKHGPGTIPVMAMARPLVVGNDFRGMVAVVVSLESLRRRLQESAEGGLVPYVVDRDGRLVVHPDEQAVTIGQDMNHIPIVQEFRAGTEQASLTQEFELEENGRTEKMLGTSVAVPEIDWGVIAQKRLAEAYFTIDEMERFAFALGALTILLSVVIGYSLARRLTTPIQVLAETTRAIARGDFSRRVDLPSRTEIGELAQTFNVMTDDLEKYVEQLKQAAHENHELFLGSIRTLAAAIDEKDPYTRGHSGRVAKYSTILAETMGLPEEEIYRIRISALLHDVGKIGIDDRVLKKPAGLTEEEFELMKQHPVKGANIIRPVTRLREMIPGIELHHESLDGHGYPYGLKGEEIPLMARIITVADTLDAMTTNRPYQAAMELEVALEKIRALQGKKFDTAVVDALYAAVEQNKLKLTPQMIEV